MLWIWLGRKFYKTCDFFKRLKNVFFSRYELSFKQETLFKVAIYADNGWGAIYNDYLVGTVTRGTFTYELEPFVADKDMIINRVEISHMSLPPKVLYGPFHLMDGDSLKVSYTKVIGTFI
jgi:hypothetical protein